jgi:hypothetical protein
MLKKYIKDMETFRDIYLAKKGDYTFSVFHIEECKHTNDSYSIKIREYSGYVHNCGPTTPHIVQRKETYDNVTYELRALLYDEDLKYHQPISKENYDKIAELYDNYHKVFVETGRKIKKLIK